MANALASATLFFPTDCIASHVTRSGDRPTRFASRVTISARFGMDLDLNKLSAQHKAISAGVISLYKKIREVTPLGDLYRLENPHENFRGALNFVSPARSRAVVVAFQLKDGENVPVHPQGLDPTKNYTIHELNPAPDRAENFAGRKNFTGEELMCDGILLSCSKAIEACVIELGSQSNKFLHVFRTKKMIAFNVALGVLVFPTVKLLAATDYNS